MTRILSTLFCALVFFANVYAGDTIPNWGRQAASLSVPVYDKEVPAVVLQDEQQVSLDTQGRIVTTENFAVKLLTREGKRLAVARAFYLVSAGKVREIEAWLLRPDGSVKIYDKKAVLDVIADNDDVYNEGRVKIIDGSGDIDVNGIFGYTIVTEDVPLFYQDVWMFQSYLPTLVSRYTLNLPQGWTASSTTFNNPSDIKPQVNGSSYTWELKNLAPIPIEPLSPSVSNLAPRIAVNYAPDNKTQTVNRTFADWLEVSQWATSFYDSQVIIDDAIANKTREITANAKTELEKIRAVGNYVQNLQYISIDIGVAYGNGYKPRSSSLVMSRGYGDCKDKATLMRAMLKVLKIEAFPVVIYSGDPNFVREEWASPKQFNHCIVAVKISSETNAPTVINHQKLGRLLIFDATDSYTPVGDLPEYLQGSNALVIAGENGGLVKMPVASEIDFLERKIEVNLTESGALKGKISERANGQTSSTFRRELRMLSAADYKKVIESWLTRGSTGALLNNFSTKDREAEAAFDLDVDFSAANYAQLMQGKLLIFKPVIVGRRNGVTLTENRRTHPVTLYANTVKETAVFTLPQGFTVDEVPDAINLDTPFGKYSTKYEIKDGKLFFTRNFITNRVTVPVEKYSQVKDFYSKIHAAEQVPVVLLRK